MFLKGGFVCIDTVTYEKIRIEKLSLRELKRVDSLLIIALEKQIRTSDLIMQTQKADIKLYKVEYQKLQKTIRKRIRNGIYWKIGVVLSFILGVIIGK